MGKQLVYSLILLLIITSSAFAEKWVSPVEIKYKKSNPVLFEKYLKARDIILNWQGGEKDLNSAKKIINTIIRTKKDFAPAHRERARIFIMEGYVNDYKYKKGSLDLAEKSILRAIGIEPAYEDAYLLLAHLYTNRKQLDMADAFLDKARNLGTGSPWLYLNRAEILELKGDYKKALAWYMKIVSEGAYNDKAFSTALDGVTICYEKLGDYEKAEKWFKKGIRYQPENVVRRVNYAIFLLYSVNEVDRSIEVSEETLKKWNYDMVHFTLGCALYTKWAIMLDKGSSPDKARDILNYAILAYPDIDRVIKSTSTNPFTKITADKLVLLKNVQQGIKKK